jgi:hypothetical protein
MNDYTKSHEQRVEYVISFFPLLIFYRELRKQLDLVREETQKFKDSERDSHLVLEKLREEYQNKKKKVYIIFY